MVNKIYVINSRGEKEFFSPRKVYQSARKAGASKQLAEKISQQIEKEVYPEIRTLRIFQKIKKLLSQESPRAALKFHLKQSLFKLGPSGFPFEKFIGEIFSNNGFKVKLNQIIQGKCLSYEIDFLAQKDNFLYFGECKFRNRGESLIHSKVALANYARFLDIKEGNSLQKLKNPNWQTILVTNNKFSRATIKFSQCKKTGLLGWRYPKGKSLEKIIEEKRLYPITILPSFKKSFVPFFNSAKIMLAKDILQIDLEKFSQKSGLPLKKLLSLNKEAKILLGENNI